MSGQIFISYRRDDTSASAGRLYDRLSSHFPSNRIFIDVDNIAPGVDFVEAIEKSVGSCDLLISVIGKNWLTSSDDEGKRRLDNPEDFVRLEIGAALRRNIRVIPVLVEGASMPRFTELPDDLKLLARRNAFEISHNRFRADSERLVAAIRQALEEAKSGQRGREKKELLESKRFREEETERLEAERQSPPPGPVAPSTSPAKRQLHPVALILTLVALVIGLAVAATIYFSFPRPSPKSTTLEPMVRPSVGPSTPVAGIIPSASPMPLTPEVSVQPSAKPTAPVAVVPPSPAIIATPSAEEQVQRFLEKASKEQPWQNSLGMKFVPVAGTQVLFGIWDTRVEDFRAFVDSTDYDATGGMWSFGKHSWQQRGATWKEPGFKQGSTDPVVGVSWVDAKAFCEWLTKRDRGSGALPEGMHYRLPTDEEWSIAVGLDTEPGNTPQELLYPWGKEWPPPPGAGNYAGEETRIGNIPNEWGVIKGYNDGYPRTSPVGSFAANKNGLYDMGGNVWQWCEDWYNYSENKHRVLSGASWYSFQADSLRALWRYFTPDLRGIDAGFRCVVARESSR